jgi:hypothetical protein
VERGGVTQTAIINTGGNCITFIKLNLSASIISFL